MERIDCRTRSILGVEEEEKEVKESKIFLSVEEEGEEGVSRWTSVNNKYTQLCRFHQIEHVICHVI